MDTTPTKADWKKFQEILPALRERYLKKTNAEIRAILENQNMSPTECFWAAAERVRQESKILHDCLDGYSKGWMIERILLLQRYNMFIDEDFNHFSPELQEEIRNIKKRMMG